jgi:hypothetical protein
MKRSRVVASVLVLFMVCGPWSEAMAKPILYTIEFVASGTVGDEPINNQPVVVEGVTDSETIDQIVADFQTNGPEIAQTKSLEIAHIMSALSYVADLAFGVDAILKFKQHRDNPTMQLGEVTHLILIAMAVSFTSPLTKNVVRDGNLVTLSIDSIQGNQVVFRTHSDDQALGRYSFTF